jgi:hypothetical protein
MSEPGRKARLFLFTPSSERTLKRTLFLPSALLVIAVLLIYFAGLKGGFFFDDEPNILLNDAVKWTRLDFASIEKLLLAPGGGFLGRPVSMLTFALNHYFSGLDPFYFKLTNVFIHALNSVGAFALTWLLLSACRKHIQPALEQKHIQWLSVATATAWALHPLNLTSVLFVVQRMTSLAAMFTLLGLIFYVWGRLRMLENRRGLPLIIGGFVCWLLLALLSKENGALLPLYLFVLEWTLFRFEAPTENGRRSLYAFFIVTLALPILWVLAYSFSHPAWLLSSYQLRDFNLSERLLTETRVLWFYLRLILVPDITQMGLFHDDIVVSRNLTEPLTTLFSVAGLAALLAVAVALRRRAPILSLGILWFLVGHSMESTIFPLEIAHEHRNYLPMYGILLAVMYYLLYPFALHKSHRTRTILALAIIVLFAGSTALRAMQFGNELNRSLYEVEHHPASARANYQAGRTLLAYGNAEAFSNQSYYQRTREYLEKSCELDANAKAGYFALFYLNKFAGRPVEQPWIEQLKGRLRDTPFLHGDRNFLVNMSDALIKGTIELPPQEALNIFQAALDNPTLAGQARAIVLAALRDYHYSYLHDSAAALNFAGLAIEADPGNMVLKLDYAAQLALSGQLDKAEQQATLVAQGDTQHTHDQDILRLRQMIDHKRGGH